MSQTLTIRAFGIIADIIGTSMLTLEPVADTQTLKKELEKRFPELKDQSFVFSVNLQLVHSNTLLDAHSEIGLMPPFSGG